MTRVTGEGEQKRTLATGKTHVQSFARNGLRYAQHFCLAHCPPCQPLPPGTSWPDLTYEGAQPVNPDVVPKAAPRAVEGGDRGQGRVEEGPRERSGCVGREAWPSVSLASFERPTKSWTRRPVTLPACREHLCCCPAPAAASLGLCNRGEADGKIPLLSP